MKPITHEQHAYIVTHINDRPRAAVARAVGVSMSTVYTIARKMGADMQYHLSKRNPQWEAIIRRHYATMSGHEIERKFGITKNRANKIAASLGLRHSPETEQRIQLEAVARMRSVRQKIDEKARARKWKTRRRIDELRVMEGKPQRTAFRFRSTTRRAYKAIFYLVKTYGYIRDPDNPYTLLYDQHTRRRPELPTPTRTVGTEQYYENKYHLKFKEYLINKE